MAELDNRFAVLIDADNVSSRYIKPILDELSTDGVITYKRIYGDWTSQRMSPWKNILLNNSIAPIQQYGYTTGKNATDSAMIIDAMDILYADNVEGFCIVSSDSDFTRLASRLREAGKFVIGMGEKKTPSAFIAACNKFKYLEVLGAIPEVKTSTPTAFAPQATDDADDATNDTQQGTPVELIRRAMITILDDISEDDDEWIPLGKVGHILNKRFPDFDVRNYGFVKLTRFIDSLKCFEILEQKSGTTHYKRIYIRNRRG